MSMAVLPSISIIYVPHFGRLEPRAVLPEVILADATSVSAIIREVAFPRVGRHDRSKLVFVIVSVAAVTVAGHVTVAVVSRVDGGWEIRSGGVSRAAARGISADGREAVCPIGDGQALFGEAGVRVERGRGAIHRNR